tara:strand:+ start:1004 stop:1483 length:480 start_codon:yes stop_codon:yes gene_type:complete
MGKKNLVILSILITVGIPPITYAKSEIYKHIDENGHITYINKPVKGGKKLLTAPFSPRSKLKKAGSHKNFPKVHANTQKKRDSKRRQILEKELVTETKLLADTRQNLSNMEKNSTLFTTKINQPNHEAVQYKEKIKMIQNKVILHQRNIVALKKELANL